MSVDPVAKPDLITPPHNIEAEQGLLGALLLNNRTYDGVADMLRPEHFAEGVHGRIYGAISTLIDGGHTANPVTLKALFDQDGALDEIGGARYLARLATSVVTIMNVDDYARTIVDLWVRRQVIEACLDGVTRAQTATLEGDGREVVTALDQRLSAVLEGGTRERRLVSAGESATAALRLADEAYKSQGKLRGLTTGLTRLDHLLGGLQDEHYYILGGRPSMGKTILADRIAVAAARRLLEESGGRTAEPVMFFSMEMTAEALARRRLAAHTRIQSQRIQRGELDRQDWDELFGAQRDLDRLALYVDDTRGLTAADMRSRSRRLKRSRGLALVVVDYIQTMRGSPEAMRSGETAVVSEISRSLQHLAGELRVPVLALSQLSRDLERREDKRPSLADLRQSGSLEQDADVVLFVYRDEYYLERAEPVQRDGEAIEKFQERFTTWENRREAARGKADVIIAKHRNGPLGVAQASFNGACAVFEDIAQASENTTQGGLAF